MTRKIFTLLLFVVAFVFVQAQVKMEIPKAAKAPTVDGYIDDVDDPWGSFIDIAVRNASGTTTGMTGKFKLLAAADAFYVAIVVQDATPNNDLTAIPNSYERDCAEMFFAVDTVTGETGAYKTGCWQLRCQREAESLIDGNSGPNTWGFASMTANPLFQVGVETSATEWTAELVIPFDGLITDNAGGVLAEPWTQEYVRFDVALADNTTGAASGRTEQKYWYGRNGAADDHGWDNTKALAICKLPTNAVTTLNTVKASAFVSNNVLNVKNVNGVVGIYNMKGSLVRSASINGNGSIAIADLQSGLYIVKGKDLAIKFVK